MADLMRHLWTDQTKHPVRAVAPRPFKRALGKFRSEFQGYDQQDAHEFLLAVLSAVHEDTNRCDPIKEKKKLKDEKKTLTKIKDKKEEKEGEGGG